jgi:hypothetical protein
MDHIFLWNPKTGFGSQVASRAVDIAIFPHGILEGQIVTRVKCVSTTVTRTKHEVDLMARHQEVLYLFFNLISFLGDLVVVKMDFQ